MFGQEGAHSAASPKIHKLFPLIWSSTSNIPLKKKPPHPPAEVGVAKCDSQIYQYTNTSTMNNVFIVLEPQHLFSLQGDTAVL